MEVVEDFGYSEVENKRKKRAEERCADLEMEIVKEKSEYEALEARFRSVEAEKLAMEKEIRALKRRGDDSGKVNETDVIVDLNEDIPEEDEVFQLMLENRVLECEKKNAESEAKSWKGKFEELELRMSKLDRDLVSKDGEVCRLMLGNKVLECEKKNAESEVESWKHKFEELESRVLKLDRDLALRIGEFPLMLSGDAQDSGRREEQNDRNELEDGLNVGAGRVYARDRDRDMDLVDRSSNYQSPDNGISCNSAAAMVLTGTPPKNIPHKHRNGSKEEKNSDAEYGYVRRARKHLEFKEEKSPRNKMAPPTPGGGRPFSVSVIDISDSDDELPITENPKLLPIDNQRSGKISIPLDLIFGDGCKKNVMTRSLVKQTNTAQNDEEDIDDQNEALLFSTPKRKRVSNVVTSDSESSDDNVPICTYRRRHTERKQNEVESDMSRNLGSANATGPEHDIVTSPRRHLVRLRKCEGTGRPQRKASQTSETEKDQVKDMDVDDNEPVEVESESEGESLGGFIVESSDISKSNDTSTESNSVSDDDVNFDETLSTLQRKKDPKTRWEFEGDMLAAFGKDPELCMKAVCALYRQQTSEEKFFKGSLLYNSRGFSKFDAFRGSNLAEFLTDGDPNGDMNKTVEELEKHGPKAIETCRKFAIHYSKQLFEIYKNKEDPLFLPN